MDKKRSKRPFRSSCTLSPVGPVCALVGLVWFVGAVATASASPSSPPTEFEFDLEDQFGRRYQSSEFVNYRLVFIGGNRDASDDSRAWAVEARNLVNADDSSETRTEIIRLADLRAVPAALKGLVARKMRGRYETPVLMDWQGTLADKLGFQPGFANVVIVDDLSEVRLVLQAQQPEPQQVELLRQVLAALDHADLGVDNAARPSSMTGPGL